MSQAQQFLNPLFGQGYAEKVAGIAKGNLIGFWRLAERSGTTAVNYEGTAARDGTYSGPTLAAALFLDGQPTPQFDAVNDVVDLYSASLSGAFDGGEGTVLIWAKVRAASVWSDASNRYPFFYQVDANNRVYLQKSSVTDRLDFYYVAGGVTEFRPVSGHSPVGWSCYAISWSKTADEVKCYIDGVQQGATMTGLGTWAGSLDSDKCNIGAIGAASPSGVYDGYLANHALWDAPLTSAQIEVISKV